MIFTPLRRWWRRRHPRHRLGATRNVSSMSDVPNYLGNSVFLVGDEGRQKWAVLSCPCGCGERLQVNLMRSRLPYWRVSRENGKLTMTPSLWLSHDKCGSHFWIEDGEAVWV